MRKSLKIPTIVGIFFLIIGLVAGIFLIQSQQVFRLGASEKEAPKNIRLSNITDKSFTVSWTTDKETSGFVLWGKTAKALSQTAEDLDADSSFVHSIDITGLAPLTTYYLKINSNGNEFDNSGIPWQLLTAPTLATSPKSLSISGNVILPNGQPPEAAIVYATISGGSLASTLVSRSGSWVIPISATRTSNLSAFVDTQNPDASIEISAQAGNDEVGGVLVKLSSAQPVAPIIIGQNQDLRSNTQTTPTGTEPEAKIETPVDGSEPQSRLTVPDELVAPASSTVTVESVVDGEVVNSTKPEFFGTAPAGTSITITVHSDPITASVTTDTKGNWSWSPSGNLPEGEHTLELSWRDAGGILRTLTKTFVVSAATNNPAFVSTPSATPKLTATPKATATTSSQPTIEPTLPPTPESGSLTPTLLLSIMGIGSLLVSGLFVYKAFRD